MDNNPHILGTERIGKLLLQYSIPAIIGMTITSLYNIIDSIFIGHGVGADVYKRQVQYGASTQFRPT